MSASPDLTALQRQRDELQSQLAQIGEMRPGSLVARFRKCGKPTCHCAKKGAQGHGPSHSLTWPVAGKTVTRVIPVGAAVEQTRQQLDQCHRFRQLVQQLLAVSEQICDWQLRHPEPQSEGIKKNFARRSARGRDSVGHGVAAGSPEPSRSGSGGVGVGGPATGAAGGSPRGRAAA